MGSADTLQNVDLVLVAICVVLSIVARLLGIKDARFLQTNVNSCPSSGTSNLTRNDSGGDLGLSNNR
jgi:hypothetical protein